MRLCVGNGVTSKIVLYIVITFHTIDAVSFKQTSEVLQMRTNSHSGDIACHTHEDSLDSQLQGPKPHFLDPAHSGLVILDVAGEGFVGLLWSVICERGWF
jgi:hypothetical protein